jgi:hypothetical protein
MVILLAGCASNTPADDVPAVITNASSLTHDEIQRTISVALGGAPVTIAPEALTEESVLSIERKPVLDQQGLRVDGRDPGRPEIFELRKKGRLCTLVQQRTGKRLTLALARCIEA